MLCVVSVMTVMIIDVDIKVRNIKKMITSSP